MPIRYMGTKRNIAPRVQRLVTDLKPKGRVLDLFSGMGCVAESLASVAPVHTNDALSFTAVLARARFRGNRDRTPQQMIHALRTAYREQAKEELDRLADSIDQEGILVPITVFEKNRRFVLVDGERRFRCARELGLESVPALIVEEKSEHDVLVQMFNIHLVREPWRDVPTAKALGHLAQEVAVRDGIEATDAQLRKLTGLSIERVRQLRYVLTLPEEWQRYINENTIPLNFFWELKRNVIDALATKRPGLLTELGGGKAVAEAFVNKRLDGVITDTVGLRKVRPIINFAAQDGETQPGGKSFLDDTIRDLIKNPVRSIDDAYEDTVQIMVEADRLEARTKTMYTSFERLLGKARTEEDRAYIKRVGQNFIARLGPLIAD